MNQETITRRIDEWLSANPKADGRFVDFVLDLRLLATEPRDLEDSDDFDGIVAGIEETADELAPAADTSEPVAA